MLYNKIQPWNVLGSKEEYFKWLLPYMRIAAILFNDAEPFAQNDNTLSTEGPLWYLVKIGQAVSEKMFKDYEILYLYIARAKGRKPHGNKILIVTERGFPHTNAQGRKTDLVVKKAGVNLGSSFEQTW